MKTELYISEIESGKPLYVTYGLMNELDVEIVYELNRFHYDIPPSEFRTKGVFRTHTDLNTEVYLYDWKPIYESLEAELLPLMGNYRLWCLENGTCKPTEISDRVLAYRNEKLQSEEREKILAMEREREDRIRQSQELSRVLVEFDAIKYKRKPNQTFTGTGGEGEFELTGWVIYIDKKPEMGIDTYKVGKKNKYTITHINTGMSIGKPKDTLREATTFAVWLAPLLSGLGIDEITHDLVRDRWTEFGEYLKGSRC
jgi:hypothetical protein